MKCSQFRHAAAGLAILAAVSLLAPTGARAEMLGSAAVAGAATSTASTIGGGLLWDEGWSWAATLMSQLRQLVLGGAPRPSAPASPARQARQAAGATPKSTTPSRDVTTSVDPTGNNASDETYPTINPDGLQ